MGFTWLPLVSDITGTLVSREVGVIGTLEKGAIVIFGISIFLLSDLLDASDDDFSSALDHVQALSTKVPANKIMTVLTIPNMAHVDADAAVNLWRETELNSVRDLSDFNRVSFNTMSDLPNKNGVDFIDDRPTNRPTDDE